MKFLTFPARKAAHSVSRLLALNPQVFLGFNLLTSLDGAALLRVSGGLTELHIQVTRFFFLVLFLEFV